jgi:hypothetical protein
MRLFQKKGDVIGNEYEWESQSPIPYEDHTPSTANENDNEYPKNNKQSIGQLVRKLNCSSSKKHDRNHHEDQRRLRNNRRGECTSDHYWDDANSTLPIGHNNSQQWKDSVSHPPLRTVVLPEIIKRPVLITVKNGDLDVNKPVDSPKDSSFIVEDLSTPSKMCTSSSFRLGMSARKRQHNAATKYFQKLSTKDSGDAWPNNWNSNKNKHSNVPVHPDIDAKRVAKEAARRERWKRGLEMERRNNKNTRTATSRRDKNGDDSSDDSLTIGSQTTGTTTTGYDTGEDSSSTDDWTNATDESRLAPKYHRYKAGGHCTSGQYVTENVVEDFGIFAQLILSDGYACFGTAADITKETVVGCKGT